MAQLEIGNPLYHEVRGNMTLRELMDKAIELGMSSVGAQMCTDSELVTFIARYTGNLQKSEPQKG